MKNNGKRGISITSMLILFALVPLTVTAIILVVISSVNIVNSIKTNTREELEVASQALRDYYEYDIINNIDLVDGFCEYDTTYIDKIKSRGVDLTLFKENIRFMTTIKDDDGKRIEGTKASDEVWKTVSSGEEYYSDDVVINGKDYYVYYMPLTDGHNVYGMAFAGKSTEHVNKAIQKVISSMLLMCLALIVMFVFIALTIAKKVSEPLKQVSNNIKDISNGKLNIDVVAKSNVTETITLIESASTLTNVLGESIGKIKESTETIDAKLSSTNALANETSDSANQIAQSMQELANTTFSMTESVQSISENVNTMDTIIDNVVNSSNKLSNNANSMAEANKEANACINNISESSKKSSNAIEDISIKINDTNSAVAEITEMVDLITNIATQTNLLSLNASIEAARAGEAGRGFAVVAGEIKTLAEQSNTSADKIKTIVSNIGTTSSECVKQSDIVRDIIAEQRRLLEEAQEKFSRLNNDINNSIVEIDSVSAVTEQLTSIKDVIASAVTDLSSVAEESTATNEEVAATVDSIANNINDVSSNTNEITTLSNELYESVKYFN